MAAAKHDATAFRPGKLRDPADLNAQPEPGNFGAYVVTADPDALYGRTVAAGAAIIDALHETDYGSRDFGARDPEGNRWSFGTYPGAPRGS